jgi:hypothetical protein
MGGMSTINPYMGAKPVQLPEHIAEAIFQRDQRQPQNPIFFRMD